MKAKQRHTRTAIILHWIYAPAVITSILSGFYIHNPSRFNVFHTMDSAKKVHAVSQYALIFSFLARIVYGFKDKNYREIIPNRKTWLSFPGFLKYEFFLSNKKVTYPKYNPGQKLLITNFALVIPIQIITGLALYSKKFEGTAKAAGGLNPVRLSHYVLSLMLVYSVSGHLYFAFTHGFKKLKSIFTGYE
ncbi:cytochrome b/b6 domain-containing protein [Dehalobacter sp. DCM]|uniref:cytochrome b/b6 domain-containing protein n=1 Tax=Dehalobacter sp. DCM TaxID=2907827 RepID=UPI0030821A2F|nr:cytochrome b/b6 domain-containing protein [Dehalobacter sp. DCM]